MPILALAWNGLVSLPILLLALMLVLRWLKASGLPLRRVPALRLPPWEGREEAGGRETALVFGGAFLFRALVFILASWAVLSLPGGGQGLAGLWMKWDGFHYVHLVEQGYAGYMENGRHLFLVFYPLYVWLARAVRLVVGDTLLSGILVSALCYSGGCAYLYRLAYREYGRAVAWRSVLLLSLFPFAFFFGGMMTEGLFLLTTAAGLYHIRRHQWLRAGLWGVLAALTRMHGLLLIGAALAELGQAEAPFAPGQGWKKRLSSLLKPLPAIFLPVLGTLGYLGLNYAVDGDPFAFVRHQEHWSQGFQWVSGVLGYLTQNVLGQGNLDDRLFVWLPELVLFPIFFLLLWKERGRHRSMFTLYAYVSLVLDYSLSWLLSAGRYLSCAIPFFIFAARLTEKKPRLTAALAGGMGALFAAALLFYLTGKPIM